MIQFFIELFVVNFIKEMSFIIFLILYGLSFCQLIGVFFVHFVYTETDNVTLFVDKKLDLIAVLVPEEFPAVDANVLFAIVFDGNVLRRKTCWATKLIKKNTNRRGMCSKPLWPSSLSSVCYFSLNLPLCSFP
jgi:hypothetical protein